MGKPADDDRIGWPAACTMIAAMVLIGVLEWIGAKYPNKPAAFSCTSRPATEEASDD